MKEDKSVSTKLISQSLREGKLPIAIFLVLNGLDIYLTNLAISLGSHELNPIMNLGHLPLMKVVLSVLVVLLLCWFQKVYLLRYVNIGMCVVVAYNALALWSWM